VETVPRIVTIAGLSLVLVGLLLHFGPSIPLLGKLPGDLIIERPGFRLVLPITTCLVLSAAVSAALWLLRRLR